MLANNSQPPKFNKVDIQNFIEQHYGINVAQISELGSYVDQNFKITSEEGLRYLVKVHDANESLGVINLQEEVIAQLSTEMPEIKLPENHKNSKGQSITRVSDNDGIVYSLRVLNFIDGIFLANRAEPDSINYAAIGEVIGKTDKALSGYRHSAASRLDIPWDMKNTHLVIPLSKYIQAPEKRRLVDYYFSQYESRIYAKLTQQRMSVIHGDLHGMSLLTQEVKGEVNVTGLIDFGDTTYTYTICNIATAAADAYINSGHNLSSVIEMVKGYHYQYPLTDGEIEILYYLIATRLCTYLSMSAYTQQTTPENSHATKKDKKSWNALRSLIKINPVKFERQVKLACDIEIDVQAHQALEAKLIGDRNKHFSKALYTHYQSPLFLHSGALQYLYTEDGETYLDCVNNVCQWGHCHPHIVRSAQQQMANLNTNSRYIYEQMTEYAQRLTDTLPEPLSVCYFVNSGSEANDLALRLARTITKQNDVIVIDTAYHGNSSVCTDISPHRIDRPGRPGLPGHVHKTLAPNTYDGPYKGEDAGKQYAQDIDRIIDDLKSKNKGVAAFIAESLIGTGGQIVLPEGYLQAAYQYVRQAGGITIADEVQVGFGRTGDHVWCFEDQGVVPDIVTMGKPIGNGHPMAAVVTTPEIAAAFDGGVPYFNTFGGNPVSCATGLAVLDVLQNENIQDNVITLTDKMMTGLAALKNEYACITDVRGLGLYIGVEIQKDGDPDAALAESVVEAMKQRGVLLNTNGYGNNIIKIKPPLIIDEENVDTILNTLSAVFNQLASQS